MSHDRSTVEAVIADYFDGLYEGDADKLGGSSTPPPICAGRNRVSCR